MNGGTAGLPGGHHGGNFVLLRNPEWHLSTRETADLMPEPIASISKESASFQAEEDAFTSRKLYSPGRRRGMCRTDDRISLRHRATPARAFFNLVWYSARWKYLRGGWYPSHVFHHRPFRLELIPPETPVDVMVAIVDHFEPSENEGNEAAVREVESWCAAYREVASRHRDADGRMPQHTWFHRFEYLNPGCIRALSEEAYRGFGEVEFHLHHGYDTHESFAARLQAGLALGNRFGAMLTAESHPRQRFAYIAGNWSLDNGSGDPRKSGCNTELIALRDAGCYADFTFPAIGSYAQPRKSNSIYYATDGPRPKSYDAGVDVEVGRPASGDLLIVQGPLLFDWRLGWFEGAWIENFAPPYPERLGSWLRANLHVRGRPEWIFVKLHTHGLQSRKGFLSPELDEMFGAMEACWNQQPFRLHYVTAREMYNIIKAAEAGHSGDPNAFRDFDLPRPANRLIRCDRPWHLETFQSDRVRLVILDPGLTTIEFESGPLRRVRGWIKSLEARFHHDKIEDLKIDGEGSFHVETRDGKPLPVPSVPLRLLDH